MAIPLTVVMTSFNRESFIASAIESVLTSDFRDFQLLVLDDASSDGTAEIARSYASRDRRVRVVVNERNLGDYANRNRAIELVSTPYLKYHDSDDLMYPHCLTVMMRSLEEAPEAGFALSASRSWSGGPVPMFVTPRLAYLREYLGPGMFNQGPAAALFRTEVLKHLGGFPERGAGSDYCFWLKACAEVPVLLAPADLFWYRSHPGQELRSPRSAADYAVAQGEGWRALVADTCPLEGKELELAKRSCTARLLKLSWRDVVAGQWTLLVSRLRSAGIAWSDWLRYPPSRVSDPWAGTPLDVDGCSVVVPARSRDAENGWRAAR